MKNLKFIIKLMLVASILTVTFGSVACTEKQTANYNEAILNISASATSLTVTRVSTSQKVTTDNSSAEFKAIIGYIAKSTLYRNQPRFVEFNGEETEIEIPYVIAYNLKFTLSDKSHVIFEYVADQLFYLTEDTMYAGYVDTAMTDVLNQVLNK